MAIVLNGTTGITNDGGYTGDGVVFADTTPANTLVTTTGGNVGIGTSTIISKMTVAGGVALFGGAGVSGNAFYPYYNSATSYNAVSSDGNGGMTFITGVSAPSVRATIDNSGNLLVGTTTTAANNGGLSIYNNAGTSGRIDFSNKSGVAQNSIAFYYGTTPTVSGTISTNSASVSYNTTSDYRLKENVRPLAGALGRVAALKPVTYTWKVDGSNGEGFIAHELQAVCPDAVTGEKDAVDAEGKPIYQGIDTSFLVATLTAAIQEQQQLITALTARVAALEGTTNV